jgi:hypothetical protein
VFRITVEGVVVRYVEDDHEIQLTVEGDLPHRTVDALVADLAMLENAPCEAKEIPA